MVALFIVFNMIYVLLLGLINRHRRSRKHSKKRGKKFVLKVKYQKYFLESSSLLFVKKKFKFYFKGPKNGGGVSARYISVVAL